jgi:predicted nucleic acid-binding protein
VKLAYIDSQVLIWGVQGLASPNRVGMIPRAQLLFETLETTGYKIGISSVTVGEYLLKVEPQDHQSVLTSFARTYDIGPYDLAAAGWAAILWGRYRNSIDPQQAKPDETPDSREIIRADCQILATAIVRGAEVLYTEDPLFAKLCRGEIRIESLPQGAVQLEISEFQTPRPIRKVEF